MVFKYFHKTTQRIPHHAVDRHEICDGPPVSTRLNPHVIKTYVVDAILYRNVALEPQHPIDKFKRILFRHMVQTSVCLLGFPGKIFIGQFSHATILAFFGSFCQSCGIVRCSWSLIAIYTSTHMRSTFRVCLGVQRQPSQYGQHWPRLARIDFESWHYI